MGRLTLMSLTRPRRFVVPARRSGRSRPSMSSAALGRPAPQCRVAPLHQRATTPPGEKLPRPVWVAPEKAPLGVARHSFDASNLIPRALTGAFSGTSASMTIVLQALAKIYLETTGYRKRLFEVGLLARLDVQFWFEVGVLFLVFRLRVVGVLETASYRAFLCQCFAHSLLPVTLYIDGFWFRAR